MSMVVQNYNNEAICLGNNVFETGVVTLANGGSCKAGQFLKRSSGKFVVVTDTDSEVPVAVAMDDITNSTGASADFPCRVIIAGIVNADKLLVNASAPTAAQLDMVRSYSIIPVAVKELAMQDNQ
ncbi:MAG: hypothetical protein IKT97_07735 [Spirochaetia bacterium]|nr:hypothetical protein [Spirochaetia bacterium]